ncbi:MULTISPECIES: glycosyltransferase family protein [Citrobacter]|uniref:glycosyltransferase n=1 Tax=Citrobacter TaxID=544 RepID=UPI001121EF12|nr:MULTISPECIES: glycosyltransferase [Citrobacter]EKX2184781.1 glycosyltransferase [Citrobacter freundii]MBA7994660.1 glycosyltransferase [Citrobacter freundii]MBJ8967970.1 glycosyltransferase [Citrobacter freundii]MDV1637369.1 glycosyltransferase [Citrobacter freundii]MDV1716780.1 glycosyltransferase [Citrobacter freundii]
MRILLVGEFSGVHTQLSKALKESGHFVTTISDGDAYKNFPRDITIPSKNHKSKILLLVDYFFDFLGVKGLFSYFKYKRLLSKLSGFDIVQFINPAPLSAFGSLASILLIRKISKQNKKLVLCALGDDYRWVNACLHGNYKYSALDNLNLKTLPKYLYTLKYKYGIFYKQLQWYVEAKCSAIIPGLIDYQIAYEKHPKLTKIVRLPLHTCDYNIDVDKIKRKSEEIIIFHGWQIGKEFRKGNYLFDDAMKVILDKYGKDKIKYVVCKSVPYQQYLELLSGADIFLDQVYSYDYGVNGLLGMAYCSVVFSGFEDNADNIGVNAIPDLQNLIGKLSFLIENPSEIEKIKCNAYNYFLENHNAKNIANEYIKIWENC